MKKKIVILAIFAVITATAVTSVLNRHKVFFYAGTVEATEVEISARLTGIIGEVAVKEGDEVKKGDLLVYLSCEDIQVAAESTEKDYSRAKILLKAGSMDQGSFDKIKYRRDDTAVRLSWCSIVSPIDSTVITRYHEPGEMVSPGLRLIELADLDRPWAYIYVPQPMLSKVSLGMKINGIVPESDMGNITGTIVKINNEAEFTPKNVQTRKERTRLVFGIKVEFDNSGRSLKPGMTVEMSLPEG
ncbi:MAG: efflux RND transporter periplasmic adaptor subunit [Elusimicrobiota bacterium]